MFSQALVSCLMVTKPRRDRLPFIQASITAYARQTYRPIELVVLFDEGEPESTAALRAHVMALGHPGIRLIGPVSPASLGALRNASVREARGEIVCQWDDDDLYHPERVQRQADVLTRTGKSACYLQDVLQYQAATRMLYWTNWSKTPVHVHPGTMMCRRANLPLYPDQGAHSALGEDRALLARLQEVDGVAELAGEPHLFIYVTHEKNSWPAEHHRMLVDTLSASAGFLRRRETQLRAGLAPFDFGPGEVVMTGSNGPAFLIPPSADRLP